MQGPAALQETEAGGRGEGSPVGWRSGSRRRIGVQGTKDCRDVVAVRKGRVAKLTLARHYMTQ